MLNLSLLADIEEEIVNEQPAPTEAEITEDAKAEVAQAEEGGDIEVKDTEVLAESQILSAKHFDDKTKQRILKEASEININKLKKLIKIRKKQI